MLKGIRAVIVFVHWPVAELLVEKASAWRICNPELTARDYWGQATDAQFFGQVAGYGVEVAALPWHEALELLGEQDLECDGFKANGVWFPTVGEDADILEELVG